jgi:hypothetical protein
MDGSQADFFETPPLTELGHPRRFGNVSGRSAIAPIATELVHYGSDALGQDAHRPCR